MARTMLALDVTPFDAVDVHDVSSANLLTEAAGSAIAETGAEVVILDSYTSAMMSSGLDPNKIEFAQLAKALGTLGVLVIATAHANKAPLANERPTLSQVSGSGALAAMAQTGLAVWHPDEESTPGLVRVACMRAPETPFSTFDVEFTDTENGGLAGTWTDSATKAKKSEAEASALERAMIAGRLLAGMRFMGAASPHSVSSLAEYANIKTDTTGLHKVRGILGALADAGWIARMNGTKANQKIAWQLKQGAPEAVVFDLAGRAVRA